MACCMPKHIFNQLLSSITAFLTIFVSGIWLGWMSVVLPKWKSGEIQIPMTSDDISWTVALLDIGNFLSPIVTGYIMDRFGRLSTLRLATISFALGSIQALMATAPYNLFLARLLAGLGKGVGFTAASLYVAEIAGPKIRGALSGFFVIMLNAGLVVSMTFGPYISFQLLNWVTLAFPVVGFLLTFIIVESPYYFFICREETLAAEALARVRSDNKINSETAELEIIRKKVFEDMDGKKSIVNLVSEKGKRKALTIILVIGVLQRAGGISCVLAYASTTLPADSFWDQNITVMMFSWISVASGILSMVMVDRFGRKPLQLYSTLALFLVTGTLAVFYYLHQRTDFDVSSFVFVPHVGTILYGLFYSIGTGQIPHTLQSELFPTSVKGQASAIMTMTLAVASFATNTMYIPVERTIGIYFMYTIFAVSHLASTIFTIFCVFETKGKTLEEIQDLLNE